MSQRCGTCAFFRMLAASSQAWGVCSWENPHTAPARHRLPAWVKIQPVSSRGSRSPEDGSGCEAWEGKECQGLREAMESLDVILEGDDVGLAKLVQARMTIEKALGIHETRTAERRKARGGAAKPPRPTVVCLCGSTRFIEEFRAANLRETLAGRIVLSIGCDTKSDSDLLALGELTEEKKVALDELHKRKIDLADEILVLNVGWYVGASTISEIEYAKKAGKRIRWLEEARGKGEGNG